MFIKDSEERAAGDALGAPDVYASGVARLLDDASAFREDVLEGALVRGEDCDLVRLHTGVHKTRVVLEGLAEA